MWWRVRHATLCHHVYHRRDSLAATCVLPHQPQSTFASGNHLTSEIQLCANRRQACTPNKHTIICHHDPWPVCMPYTYHGNGMRQAYYSLREGWHSAIPWPCHNQATHTVRCMIWYGMVWPLPKKIVPSLLHVPQTTTSLPFTVQNSALVANRVVNYQPIGYPPAARLCNVMRALVFSHPFVILLFVT